MQTAKAEAPDESITNKINSAGYNPQGLLVGC